MEKALYELKIDPEFAELIPPLSSSDYENLAKSISKEGCEEDLVVWDGVIVDGHNRFKICHALGIPFGYREIDFSSREAAKKWMIQRSLGRRNLSKYDKAVLALRFEDVLRDEAKKRMKRGIRIEESEKGDTRDKIAMLAGVSHTYIDRVKKIEEVADEKTKSSLSNDEVSINKVYTRLFPKERSRKKSQKSGCDSSNDAKYLITELKVEIMQGVSDKEFILSVLDDVLELL